MSMLGKWGLVLVCALIGSPFFLPAARAEKIVKKTPDKTTTIWRIDEPNVKQRMTKYPQITFKPGDQVAITAGGCVQTGGLGKTWKRYVDPIGPNTGRLYHGQVWIPGVTSGLVRLKGVVGHTYTVPAKTDAAPLYLRLGFEDDDYSDNGYWGREGDDGVDNQCKGLGNAFVIVTIKHGGKAPPSRPYADMDLFSNALDDNAVPLNPRWGYQVSHPGMLPDPDKLCPKGFIPPCVTQPVSTDTPGGWNALFCDAGAGKNRIHGHVNWFAATYDGPIFWDSHSAPGTDDDYNFLLEPPNKAGLVAGNWHPKENRGFLELEFDSDETIDHFSTPWWNSFHRAVDDNNQKARAMVNGKFAIVTGLVGLDCEHSCATEVHPVYAMAIRVKDDPADEVWAIFVRNFGNEGFCSQDQHYLDLFDNRYTFRLPWKSGATSVAVGKDTTFKANTRKASGPDITYSPTDGVLVKFTLPGPEEHPLIHGELHLKWTGTGMKAYAFHASTSTKSPTLSGMAHGAEGRVVELHKKLTPEKRKAFLEKIRRAPIKMKSFATAPTHAVKMQPRLAVLSVHEHAHPIVRAVRDMHRQDQDKKRYEALREALGGQIPGIVHPK